MIEWRAWAEQLPPDGRPWLLLGKGPTFARRDEFDLGSFRTASLNHVVSQVDVDVAHIADLDVLEACAERLEDGCRWLVVPRHPHVDHAAGPAVEEHFERIPALRRLDEQGRLVWYNLHTAEPHGDSPVIGCRHFSSEVVLELLGRIGARTVRTLGIDGGAQYASAFSANEATRLDHGRPSFDVQFYELDRIARTHGMEVTPLADPLRIFVGCDESQQVAFRVLEHTIRSRTSQPVEIVNLRDHAAPVPSDPANRGQTGFSFRRFRIPELCAYRGRALYIDADMQVFGDIADLWGIPLDGHRLLCTEQAEPPPQWRDHPYFHTGRHFAVMVLDCEALDWDVAEIVAGIDRGDYGYRELMNEMCVVDGAAIAGTIPPEWNSLEHFEEGVTKLLHYTVVAAQPWKNDDNPLCDIWERAYEDAVAAGAVPPREVLDGIAAGHLKASLAKALELAPRDGGHGAGDETARYHIEVLQAEVERLQAKVDRLEAKLAAIRGSATWRVGRALTAPISRLREGRP